ncbi:MAG: PulJ/GspJ family protein [Actinomycetota bacterium]
MTGRGRDATEGGFTLVELLVVVAITGIISTALTTMVVQGLTAGPDAAERTAYSVDVTFFVDRFSDDLANATANPAFTGTATGCQLGDGDPLEVSGSGGVTEYFPRIAADASGMRRVGIHRLIVGNPESEELVSGYCDPTSPARVFDVDVSGPSARIDISLAPSPGLEPRSFVVGSSRRTNA